MLEIKLYQLLESMIVASKKADPELVNKLNHEFSVVYDSIFSDSHYYGKDTRPLHYDRCRNLACVLSKMTQNNPLYITFIKDIESHLQIIPKPEDHND